MTRVAWISFVFVSGAVCFRAYADKPSRLIFTEGAPLQAVFEGERETYALGCSALGMQWTGVPEAKISNEEWRKIVATDHSVADINCNSRTVKFFNPPNGPGGLIFLHHDGHMYYHYVDSPAFMYAIDSDPAKPHPPQKVLTTQQLQSMGYIYGTEFTTFEAPRPPWSPPPVCLAQVCSPANVPTIPGVDQPITCTCH